MDIRRNHRDMSPHQKCAFVEAVMRLKNNVESVLRPGQQSRYDDFVQIHKNSMGRGNPLVPNPHRSPLFYPWHRVLIRQFELALQAAVDDPRITLPYWNWQISGADNPFTSDFMGGNGDNTRDMLVTTGAFSNEQSRFIVRVWDEETGNAGLRRNLGVTGRLPSAESVISALNTTPYWMEPGGWENVSERELHDPVHAWIGGNMAEASSPNDPLFFLHHCYMDLLWERWRQLHPKIPSFPVDELSDSILVFHPENEPAPWAQSFTIQQALDTTELGNRYEYL